MKTMKIFFGVAVLGSVATYACAIEGASTAAAPQQNVDTTVEDPQYKAMGLNEIIGVAKKENARDKKMKIAQSLSKKIPMSSAEVSGALDFLDTLKDKEGDDLLKGAAKESMRNLKDPGLAPAFAARIKQGGYESRQVAIQKVAEFKYKKAVPDLIDVAKGLTEESSHGMKAQEAYLKLNAFNALGDIGDESAIPAVLEKLGKLNGRDSEVIGKFGLKVLPRLIEVTKASKNEREKESAYSAISSMKDKEAIPLLWETAKTSPNAYLKNVAIGALLKTTDENSRPTKNEVSAYLYAEADTRKTLRPQTMGIAKKNKDVEYLARIATDKSPDNRGNRVYAIMCLGEIKASSAVPMLEEVLKESDKEIRINAAVALKQITGKEYDWRQK
jgi:HEAT repeat protein